MRLTGGVGKSSRDNVAIHRPNLSVQLWEADVVANGDTKFPINTILLNAEAAGQ